MGLPAPSGWWQMTSVKLLLVLLALLVLLGVACGGDPSHGSLDGRKVFESSCATCHGAKGQPSETMVAQLGVRDLTSPELRARVTPALVEQQVRTGSTNKLMPSFEGSLTDAQIKAVAAYVASPGFVAK